VSVCCYNELILVATNKKAAKKDYRVVHSFIIAEIDLRSRKKKFFEKSMCVSEVCVSPSLAPPGSSEGGTQVLTVLASVVQKHRYRQVGYLLHWYNSTDTDR
jgi:hypothetical protein